MGSADPHEMDALSELTDRQMECLRYTGEGMSSKEIGRILGISPSTVDNHIHTAIAKLHAKNRWQAAQLLHPERTNLRPNPVDRRKFIPPLGGRPNSDKASTRLLQILSIALVSLILVSGVIASIVAAIRVFSTF